MHARAHQESHVPAASAGRPPGRGPRQASAYAPCRPCPWPRTASNRDLILITPFIPQPCRHARAPATHFATSSGLGGSARVLRSHWFHSGGTLSGSYSPPGMSTWRRSQELPSVCRSNHLRTWVCRIDCIIGAVTRAGRRAQIRPALHNSAAAFTVKAPPVQYCTLHAPVVDIPCFVPAQDLLSPKRRQPAQDCPDFGGHVQPRVLLLVKGECWPGANDATGK